MLDSTVVCRRALGCEWGEVLRKKKKKKKLQGLRKKRTRNRTEKSAQVLVGPPELYARGDGVECRSTALVLG